MIMEIIAVMRVLKLKWLKIRSNVLGKWINSFGTLEMMEMSSLETNPSTFPAKIYLKFENFD